ncbi:HAMP domain-containing sensor histidine kinase [Sphaerisporangium sp. NPDC049002]|uniref:sensor histidine kinase n=1 Tax=unclassified Sphaerisporangium TaxID=2630420 RepID=UPI0033F4A23F
MDRSRLTYLWEYIDGLDLPPDFGSACHAPPEPSNEDEIAQAKRTASRALGKLDRALQRQRQFASDASHELRGPIAGLRAQLEEARLHPGEDDLPEVIRRALADIDRLEAIVGDLLLLSRFEAKARSAWERVDLAALVRAEVTRRADPIGVRMRLDEGVCVDVVPVQISRVLTNLLDNAQRHAERIVRVDVVRSARTGDVIVSDDGEGIAESDRERIFQRFTRLAAARARDHSGTGLGLAIAREIVQAHHGVLVAAGSPDGGACFALRLPLTDPAPAP